MSLESLLVIILKAPTFSNFVQRFGYIGIVLWFITFDQLTPIPEEISLLIIGYLSFHHVFNPVIAAVSSWVGFVIIDTAYFFLSKRGSVFIKKKTKGFSTIMESYKSKLETNTPRAIIILCFIPRMRLFAPILAGSMKLPFKKFLLYDLIGLSVFATVYITVGIVFNKSLGVLISKTRGLQNIVFFVAVGALSIAMFIIMRSRRRKDKKK